MSELTGPLADVLKKLSDPNRPFTLLVQAKIKPGLMNAFRPIADAAVKGTRQEPGNIAYMFHQALEDSDHLFLFEKWQNFDALKSHFEQPYTLAILKSYGEYSAEPLQMEVFQHLN